MFAATRAYRSRFVCSSVSSFFSFSIRISLRIVSSSTNAVTHDGQCHPSGCSAS